MTTDAGHAEGRPEDAPLGSSLDQRGARHIGHIGGAPRPGSVIGEPTAKPNRA